MSRSFAVVVAAAFVIEAALFSTLGALLPHYERELQMSTFASGVLAGCYTAGMFAGTLLAGLWMTRRFGVRPTAMFGCALLAVASVAFGAVESVVSLDLARTVQGVGAGLLWCALLNWLILATPPQGRGVAIGAAMGATVFGTAIGPVLGAATTLVGTFAVFAAVALAVVVLAVLLMRSPAPSEQASSPATGLATLRLPRDPALRRAAYLGFVPPIVAGAMITLIPLHLADLGATDAAIAVVFLVASLVAAVNCVLAGRVADRRGDRLPIVAGLALSAVCLFGMALTQGAVALALGFVLFQGVALSFSWIPLMSLFTTRSEAAGVTAAGAALVLNLTISLGYTIGPPAVTALAQASNEAVTYLALGMGLAGTFLVALRWIGLGAPEPTAAAVGAGGVR